MRLLGRKSNEIRSVEIIPDYNPYAGGSCLIKFGNTHVICTATVEESLPFFMRNSGKGWVTAEYGMLPCSTHSRMKREAAGGKQGGRTVEIQRLIGRALRAVVDLKKLGERQILLDCDVIQADGGTRTAAITGAYVALNIAVKKLLQEKVIRHNPIIAQVAAISGGVVNGEELIDLDYPEDSMAGADVNFVLTDKMQLIEVQGTAEASPFSEKSFLKLLEIAKEACAELHKKQLGALHE